MSQDREQIMDRANLKFSPAIADRTATKVDGQEEGMEAVLFNNKGKPKRRSKKKNTPSVASQEDDSSAIFESPNNAELLDLIQKKKWEQLLYRLLNDPHAAYVIFTGRSTTSTSDGNLALHEACKHDAPIDIVEALIESNEKAIMTKGNKGYLPLHCACDSGASVEVIEFLESLYPEGVKLVDDEDGYLPLHLACKAGKTKEEVYRCLLTSYPEAYQIQDYFGRLPIDYAKNILSEGYRNVAVECMERASWLERASKNARERTEKDYQQRIKGYEQFQAQQLKMIEDVHTKEIANFEATVKSQEEEIELRSKDFEALDQHLQAKTKEFLDRVGSLEKSMKTANRQLQGLLDKAKKEKAKTQVALDVKTVEVDDLSTELEQSKALIESLSEQLEQRTEDLEIALEDMDTLNKHAEWLESTLESIRLLSTAVSPQVEEYQRNNEHQSDTSTYATPAQSSGWKSIDSPTFSAAVSNKSLRGRSIKVSSQSSQADRRDSGRTSRVVDSASYRE
mmetsp:Transcript_26752/g.62523  ORF Transcript_26752/g.62523 Transcript_26752/m.62523 type:complete len:509 (-) Transcript_26752:1004-2530(-)